MAANTNSTPFYADIDLNLFQAINIVLHARAGTSHLTVEGQIGYNDTTHRALYHNGTSVLEVASLTGTETLTNKTITSPVINTQITGTAIRTYADGVRDIDTASDLITVSEKYVHGAIIAGIATNDAMVYKGSIDCSTNPNYPAASRGHLYKVSVAGKIGGASGIDVEVGDEIICNTDSTASGTQAAVGAYWDIIQTNIVWPISSTQGGTGLTSFAANSMLYASAANTWAALAPGTDGYFLKSVSGVPTWASLPTQTTTFLQLTDTPASYTGHAGKYVVVNAGATALEFISLPTYDNFQYWRINNADSASGAISLTSTSIFSIIAGTAMSIAAPSAGTTATAKLTINHSTGSGYNHLPTSGGSTQWLKWTTADAGVWTTPAALTTSAGKGLKIGASTSGSYDINTTKEIEVDFTQVAAYSHTHANYDNYQSWNLLVDTANSSAVTTGKNVDFISGTHVSATRAVVSTTGWSVTVDLKAMAANTIKMNATASSATPTDFAVTASSVVGRLSSGNIVNIGIGTGSNQVAAGDHTHAQLHNQSHVLDGSDHTVSGRTAGQFLRASAATTFGWSTLILPNAGAIGEIPVVSASNTVTMLAAGTAGYYLKSQGAGVVPVWTAFPTYDNYQNWVASDGTTTKTISATNTLVFTAGTHISTAMSGSASPWAVTFDLKNMAANSVKLNATSSSASPTDFAVSTNNVLGRLSGNIVNIPFGTSANTIAWGDHTHSALHTQQHDLLSTSDHTFTGISVGKVLRGSGTGTAAYSTFTIVDTFVINSIPFASSANTLTALAPGTDGTYLKSVSGVPTWSSLTLPTGTAKYQCLAYDNGSGGAVTTKTYAVATHGCGTKPLVYFLNTKDVNTYAKADVKIEIVATSGANQGDVTVSSNAALTGFVIFIGSV